MSMQLTRTRCARVRIYASALLRSDRRLSRHRSTSLSGTAAEDFASRRVACLARIRAYATFHRLPGLGVLGVNLAGLVLALEREALLRTEVVLSRLLGLLRAEQAADRLARARSGIRKADAFARRSEDVRPESGRLLGLLRAEQAEDQEA